MIYSTTSSVQYKGQFTIQQRGAARCGAVFWRGTARFFPVFCRAAPRGVHSQYSGAARRGFFIFSVIFSALLTILCKFKIFLKVYRFNYFDLLKEAKLTCY